MPLDRLGNHAEDGAIDSAAPNSFEVDADDISDSMISKLLDMQNVRASDIHVPSGAIIPELHPGLWERIKEGVSKHDRNLWPEVLSRVVGCCCFKVKKNETGDWVHANPQKPEIDKTLAMLISEKLHLLMSCEARTLEIREMAKRQEQEFLDLMMPRFAELERQISEAKKKK